MAKLSAKKRGRLKKSQFAIPSKRKFPIHDKRHAANAKARITQARKRGTISKSTAAKATARANKALARHS